jgi:hypothetical protein
MGANVPAKKDPASEYKKVPEESTTGNLIRTPQPWFVLSYVGPGVNEPSTQEI